LKRGMLQDVARFQILWQLQMSWPNRLLFPLHELLSVINLFMGQARQCSSSNGRQLWLMPSFHRFPLVTLDLWKHSETFGNKRNSTVVTVVSRGWFPHPSPSSSLWDPDADLRAHIWMRIRHMATIEGVRLSARIVWMLVLVWPVILGVAILVVAVVATQVSCMRKEAKEGKKNRYPGC
jgi:hypothetical protein